MKNMKRKSLVSLAVAIVLLLGVFCIPAYAATSKTVTAQLSPHYTIIVDGVEREFYNVNGQEVHPISYQNTTYLPLRAIGELMDKNVDWNQSTKTATLSGSRNGNVTRGVSDPNAKKTNITASLRYDFTIVVDGVKQTFRDANGNTVYPLLYNGSTYLPLRAIGNLMGKTVSWDGSTCTATLSSGEDSLVTDADTFGQTGNQGGTQGTTQSGSYIGEAKAKTIALNHAGLSESQVTFVRTKLDFDDGRWEYEVEFYAGNTEYDYDIDATTGNILSFDHDAEYYTAPATGNQSSGNVIGEAKAKAIALGRAGLSESQVSYIKCQLDRDDGRWEYEVEFRAGGYEYDFEIDATSGTILSYDKEWD